MQSLKLALTVLLTWNLSFLAIADPDLIKIDANFAGVTQDEAQNIANEAYMYAYPMVLMEITRRVMTNVDAAANGKAPMNQFGNMSEFPNAQFTDVVRPNADTLYSILWFDVSSEPLIFEVPAANGKYYLLQMLDMWSDVFASPGSRTSGSDKQVFVLSSAKWSGVVPAGATLIKAPTDMGWLLGRIEADSDNYKPSIAFLDQLKVKPLSYYGKDYKPAKASVNSKQNMSPPVEQVANLTATEFFTIFCDISKNNPPHANDYPILQRMNRIGIVPGTPFAVTNPQLLQAINASPNASLAIITKVMEKSGVLTNGWRTNYTAIGTYGTDYMHRSGIAYGGLGANTIEDAIYPTAFSDISGKIFSSDKKYKIHFTKEQIPPVNGFWSLTMYNDKQFFADNPINRYAIGDRDNLKFNSDGTLDLYVQRASPGGDKESNWLPAPAAGGFTMNLRLYWPKFIVLDQSWSPPPVTLNN